MAIIHLCVVSFCALFSRSSLGKMFQFVVANVVAVAVIARARSLFTAIHIMNANKNVLHIVMYGLYAAIYTKSIYTQI